MRAISAIAYGFVFSIIAHVQPALVLAQDDQVENADQLFQKIREQLLYSDSQPASITIREVRQSGGGVAPAATRVLRDLFVRRGFKISAAADAEIEAYLENSGEAFSPPSLELRLISETDNRSASIGMSRDYYNALATKNTPGAAALSGSRAEPPNGRSRKLGPKVAPISEWEVTKLDRAALKFVRDAIITKESDWNSFWSYLNTGKPAPRVNFSTEYVLVLTAPSDTVINVTLYDGGPGNLEIEPDVGYEHVPPGTEPINAAVYWLPKKISSKGANQQRVRLGVAIERSASGDGLIVKEVDVGSPATKGRAGGRFLGLEKGDTIIALNGSKTTDAATFIQSVQSAAGTIRLTVRDVNSGAINEIEFQLTP